MGVTNGATTAHISTTAALFDLSRGRQALLSVAQPALGACLALGRLPDPRVMSVGLVAATAGYLAVFSLNDVLDARTDERALAAGKAAAPEGDIDTAFLRHPLAQGALKRGAAIGWVATLGAIAATGAALLGIPCVVAFAGAVCLELLYCALRSVTWAKTFVSGAMVGLGGLAGWLAVAPLGAGAAAFFLLLATWEIAGRNIPNDLADLVADSAVGMRTVPTTFGPSTAARATAAGGAVTLALCTLQPGPLAVRAAAAVATAWAMGAPAVALLERPSPEQAGRFFNRASLMPAVFFVAVLALIAARAA